MLRRGKINFSPQHTALIFALEAVKKDILIEQKCDYCFKFSPCNKGTFLKLLETKRKQDEEMKHPKEDVLRMKDNHIIIYSPKLRTEIVGKRTYVLTSSLHSARKNRCILPKFVDVKAVYVYMYRHHTRKIISIKWVVQRNMAIVMKNKTTTYFHVTSVQFNTLLPSSHEIIKRFLKKLYAGWEKSKSMISSFISLIFERSVFSKYDSVSGAAARFYPRRATHYIRHVVSLWYNSQHPESRESENYVRYSWHTVLLDVSNG